MQEVFEKIKERLEEKMNHSFNQRYKAFAESIEIVNQVAEECAPDTNVSTNIIGELKEFLREKKEYNSEQADIWRGSSYTNSHSREMKDLYIDRANAFGSVLREIKVLENKYGNDGWISLPKVAFDRMIARMESESERDIYEEESLFINVRDAARIVHEIAEEYKHGHFGCNSNGQHERCVDCGLRGECSHCNTEWFDAPDKNVGSNDGWIPCKQFMPAELGEDWVQVQIQERDTGFLWIPRTAEYRGDKWWLTDSDEPLEDVFEVTAWRKLPSYYQPKGEE